MGYNPQGHKELDTMEVTEHSTHSMESRKGVQVNSFSGQG